MKIKSFYTCSHCGHQTVKWIGQCPDCKQWNTFKEGMDQPKQPGTPKGRVRQIDLVDLTSVQTRPMPRMLSGIKEWDRVTGGGLVPGEFLIITGDPGIGKSTLLLQIAHKLSEQFRVFYFSSEESLEQVKMRAERLDCVSPNLLFSDQANLDEIIAACQSQKPDIIIIDSIQNTYLQEADSIPGSIGQLKESAFKLMRLAKEHTICVIVSGHITKEGVMAGPKTLEHMVDAVFYLQGEDRWQTRVLRSVKNRFGTINELGFFQMGGTGLEEVPNINQYLLDEISYSPGSVLISFLEGSRPLLIELQALVLPSKYGMPQRIVTGIDPTQVALTAAILEKYLQVKLSAHDIFFKISGSFKIKTSSADLGIALALLSSYFQKPVPEKSLALGELGLTGQIKPVNQINIHAGEAEKFGIKNLMLAKHQKVESPLKSIRFHNVYELLTLFE